MQRKFGFFIKCLPVSLLMLSCFLEAYGQEISFSHISVTDGLFTNFVNCICQDKKGFLWVGTENGLQRYDGNKFVNIESGNNKTNLPSLPVDQLLYNSLHNTIWISLGGGQHIGRFNVDNGKYLPAKFPDAIFPNGLLTIDARGNVILSVVGAGVLVFNEKINMFEKDASVIDVPQNFTLFNIVEDRVHRWFYLCGKEGLMIYDPAKRAFYSAEYNPYNLPALTAAKDMTHIQYVYVDSKKRFWLHSLTPARAQGLFVLDTTTKKLTLKNIEPNIQAFHENYNIVESNGFLYCYGNNLLNIYDEAQSRFEKFYIKNNPGTGVNSSVIKQLYEDRDKNLWIISDNGLYEANVSDNYVRHGAVHSMENASFTSAQQFNDSVIICTSWGGGVTSFKYDRHDLRIAEDSSVKKMIYKGMPADRNFKAPWSFVNDTAKHQIIFGCEGGRVIVYNTSSKKSQFLVPEIFQGNTIRQVIKDNDGNYWFGLVSGKVFKLQDNTYTLVVNYEKCFISKFDIDAKGLLWIATAGAGLHVINASTNKEIESYQLTTDTAHSLASNHVANFLRLNDSVYILCLARNIDILNVRTKKVIHYTTANGLPNNRVYTIIKDAQSQAWMSTDGGIVRYDWRDNSFHSYTGSDGLVTVTSNDDLLYTSTALNNKYIMFGGEKSRFIIFNPDSISNKKIPKDVTITGIRLFNLSLPVDSILNAGFHLRHNQNSLTIDFSSLTYGGANLVYYYRLKGASDEWIKADKPYSASYASLSPGRYTFQVKCINADGLSSAHITSVDIHISKAFWQTWWFIALLIIVALIPVFIIYQLRLKRLEAVQKIREKVARDLHDDVGSTLTSINILSEFSRSKVDSESEVKNYLDRISNASSQMMDAMDDIVWNIKPANDTMIKIIARMREYAASVLEPKEIDYRFINEDTVKDVSLNMDVRRTLFLIFKENINNIAKYANASIVTIEFTVSNSALHVAIEDNGIGFDEVTVAYGNGIENMQKRAKMLNGNYSIRSTPGKGTRSLLSIPLSKFYT